MRRFRLIASVVLGGGVACGGPSEPEPPKPVPGDLTLSYTTLAASDGAILLTVAGGPVTQVSPLSPYQASSDSAGIGIIRVVVTGQLVGGDLIKLRVPDVNAVAKYSAQIEAAADYDTFLLSDPATYSAAIRK